jgi:hypothetical protein
MPLLRERERERARACVVVVSVCLSVCLSVCVYVIDLLSHICNRFTKPRRATKHIPHTVNAPAPSLSFKLVPT